MTSPGAVLVLAVLFHVVTRGQGRPTGAPVSACVTMTPRHSSLAAQNSTPPYSVSVSAASYTAGQPVTVTVTGGGSAEFKGFLLQAKTANGTIVGSFTISSGLMKGVQCGNSTTSALTHSDPSLKTSITTTWSTPTSVGDVTFNVTIVQQFTTFWVGIPASTVLKDATTPPSTVPESPEDTTASSSPSGTPPVSAASSSLSDTTQVPAASSSPSSPSGTLPVPTASSSPSGTLPVSAASSSPSSPSGTPPVSTTTGATSSVGGIDLTACENGTKGCFMYPCPQGAGSGLCAVVTWRVMSSSTRRRRDESSADAAPPIVEFELYGVTNGWAAVGFSRDRKMGDDSVVACVNDGTDRFVVQSSYNFDSPTLYTAPLSNPNLGLTDTRSQYVDGGVTCRFTRQVYNTNDSRFFNISQPFYLMLGWGPASQGMVGIHDYYPIISQSLVNVTQNTLVIGTAATVDNYVRAHACLMVVAWALLASVGVLMARTMRTTIRGKTLLGSPLWLGIHRILLITAVLCTIAGFVVIFVYREGKYVFPTGSPSVNQAHGALGIITMILAIINPIVILTRPKPGKTCYKGVGLMHKIIGWLLHPTAAVTMVLGSVVLEKDAVFWLLIAAIIVHLLAELVFLIDGWCTCCRSSSHYEIEMAKRDEDANIRVDNSNKGAAHRIGIFIAYVLTMIGLTVAILVCISLM